jgi:hypothetical protein
MRQVAVGTAQDIPGRVWDEIFNGLFHHKFR